MEDKHEVDWKLHLLVLSISSLPLTSIVFHLLLHISSSVAGTYLCISSKFLLLIICLAPHSLQVSCLSVLFVS